MLNYRKKASLNGGGGAINHPSSTCSPFIDCIPFMVHTLGMVELGGKSGHSQAPLTIACDSPLVVLTEEESTQETHPTDCTLSLVLIFVGFFLVWLHLSLDLIFRVNSHL